MICDDCLFREEYDRKTPGVVDCRYDDELRESVEYCRHYIRIGLVRQLITCKICDLMKYMEVRNNAACGSDSALAVAPDDPYPSDCGEDP